MKYLNAYDITILQDLVSFEIHNVKKKKLGSETEYLKSLMQLLGKLVVTKRQKNKLRKNGYEIHTDWKGKRICPMKFYYGKGSGPWRI